MLKINEAIKVKVLLLDSDGAPVAGTIAYVVYDEADASFATGNMTATGVTGFYTVTFTPDAAGEWTLKLSCGSPVRNKIQYFQVGKGVENDIYDIVKSGGSGDLAAHITALGTHDTDIKALLATLQADLDSPNQYKADVSALALEATLATHDTDIKALLATIQADLDNPNQYKADVSALALEATLNTHDTDVRTELQDARNEIADVFTIVDNLEDILKASPSIDSILFKSGGAVCPAGKSIWNALGDGTVSLNTIAGYVDAVEGLLTNVGYGLPALETLLDEVEIYLKHATYGLDALHTHLTDIENYVDTLETVLGTKTDTADIAGTVTAKQQAIFETIHLAVGMIVADKTSLTANETALKTALEKRFHVIVLDEDDIDAGDADLAIFSMIIVGTSITDMTKLNELTTLAVPIFTRNAQVALTILRMGDETGGAGTSYGETAAQTQINITNITHELTIDQTLGNLVVYSAGGDIQWVRKTDLVAATVQLAEMFGDNAKVSMAVLSYDGIDEDGNPAPAIRVFIGLKDFTLFNAVALQLAEHAQDWVVHQGAREIEIGGLTKVNTLISMLGRNKFRSAEDVFDYLVTGTTNAAPFETIASSIHGSILERLNAMMEKDTTPAFDSDTDSLEAISEAIADLITRTKGLNDIHDDLVTAQADLDNPAQYKADVSALALEATLGTHDTDIKALLATIQTDLDNPNQYKADVSALALEATLGTHDTDIKALLATVQADLDNPNQYKADVSSLALEATLGTHDTDIKAVLVRNISHIDFWSEGVPVVNIPITADSDINLPDVIVPALPAGATIWKVFLLFKCAIIKDTSTADNAIDEAGVIRIKKDGDATFDGNGVDAYIIEDNKWSIDVSEATERGGDAFIGKTDLGPSGANKVDGADTYELRLDSVSADGTNLVLVDVCVGLRVYFY